MRIFGYEVLKGKVHDKLGIDLEKAYSDAKFGNLRAQLDHLKMLGGEEVRIPYYPIHERTLFDLAVYSDTLRTIHMQLKKEIFRHGYLIEEKFAKKCEQCNKEFKHPTDKCDECGGMVLLDPDINQKKILLAFIKRCNDNDQDILDVSSEVNDDLETVDDGYMQLTKDYYFNKESGEMEQSVPVELLRTHPMHIRIIADRTGRPGRDAEGKIVLVCIDHRENYHKDVEYCPMCKKKMFPAYFRGETYESKYIYYIKGEIYHKSKYKPSLTYGFPPILAAWLKITTLMAQDSYMNKYYTKQRPPRGMLFINTPNMESIKKAWNWMLDQFKQNPHMIPPIAIENPTGNKSGKLVEFIDFMKSPEEMQFIEMRNEFRRQIGAIYGVMPLFQADLSASGGLNNEGLQITVTNRAIQDGQGVFNDGFYPWLLEQLEITDYTLTLEPSEEKDEMAEVQLKTAEAGYARLMQAMGFEVTLNEDEEFEFEPTETPVQPPQQAMGGFGDIGGLGQIGAKPAGSPPVPGQPKPPSQQRFGSEPESVRMSKSKDKKKIKVRRVGFWEQA